MRKIEEKNITKICIRIAVVLLVLSILLFWGERYLNLQNIIQIFPNFLSYVNTAIIVLAIGAILLVGFPFVIKWIIILKKGIHNVRQCDDEFWKQIDAYKRRWNASNEYYNKIIRVLKFYYQKGGKVDELVKNKELDRLYLRFEFLNAQTMFDNDINGAELSLIISLVASFLYSIVDQNNANYLMTVIASIILPLFLVGIIFLFVISFYSQRGKNGSYDYMINQFEIELLSKKIKKLQKKLYVSLDNEDALIKQQMIIDFLIDMRRKEKDDNKKGAIENDIHIVENLQLEITNKSECHVKEIKIGNKYIKLFYQQGKEKTDFDRKKLINDQYEKLYKILEKYQLVIEN